ncbi:hypothetical protein [Ensifer sp. LBL]|uniref:hypothetical protein n=1 Tax=Ensifer sp. LBL TaxID=2991056 RepID=UPI003D1C2154
MRGSCFAMALATTMAFALAIPAKAANYSYGCKPSCVLKTERAYGADGKLFLKKVRICK